MVPIVATAGFVLMIAVIRRVENIALVAFLNYFPIAWPARASQGMHRYGYPMTWEALG